MIMMTMMIVMMILLGFEETMTGLCQDKDCIDTRTFVVVVIVFWL
jgi:hypothetical protein